jgi:hypothetical protein
VVKMPDFAKERKWEDFATGEKKRMNGERNF